MTNWQHNLLIVLGMAAVTFLPRVAPFLLSGKLVVEGRLKAFFDYLPFAALAALTFPAVFNSTGGDIRSGAAGAVVAVLLSWLRLPILVVVFGAIGGALVVELLV
jgi:branched-subunit amino acid transport protein